MKRVYVVNNGGHDYTDAERFGAVTFCTDHVIAKHDTAQMFRELNEALQDANHDDYILISSLATLCSIACSILAARFGEVHLLIFRDGKYIERSLMLDNEEV